jgi:hypothetical protein
MIAPGDERVREVAQQVLARWEYRRWTADDTAYGWMLRKFIDFYGWMIDLSFRDPLLFWLLMASLALVACALLAHVTWSVRRALAHPSGAPAGPDPVAAPSLRDEAARRAAAGDHLEAARLLQLAVLQRLVHGGVIELAQADANRTLRRRLQSAPLPDALRFDCLRLIDRLERAWFRDRVDDPGLYAAWHGLHERLVAAP